MIPYFMFANLKYSNQAIKPSELNFNKIINDHKRGYYQDYYKFIVKFKHFTDYKCQEDNKKWYIDNH